MPVRDYDRFLFIHTTPLPFVFLILSTQILILTPCRGLTRARTIPDRQGPQFPFARHATPGSFLTVPGHVPGAAQFLIEIPIGIQIARRYLSHVFVK